MKQKIHILSDPGFKTGLMDRTRAFSCDIYKFIEHYKTRLDLVHYGLKGSIVNCRHHDLPYGTKAWNTEAARLIGKEKTPGDIILCFGGNTNQPATQPHTDCLIVEPHIGYNTKAAFAPYKIFTSYANMHFWYGTQQNVTNGYFQHRVIPNAVTVSEFEFSEKKDNYILCLGRVITSKGVHIAVEVARKTGHKLLIAGSPRSLKHMGFDKTPPHVELLGNVNAEDRKKLLANAKCLMGPTVYIEPFGLMVVEAHMSGTPTITTDWGAFPETNINGLTGFRCRTFNEFIWAVRNVHTLDKHKMRQRAIELYSDEAVYPQYMPYFEDIVRTKKDWYA